jgi:hypothetical protein
MFESERWPDEIHVALSALEQRIDREPSAHVFFSDRARWIPVCDDGLKRRGGTTGTEPLP